MYSYQHEDDAFHSCLIKISTKHYLCFENVFLLVLSFFL